MKTRATAIRLPAIVLIPDLLSGEAEPALPFLEVENRLQEILLSEIRPERLREVKLGVGGLPEQEVADPFLAGRPDEKVWVREAGGVEGPRDRRFVDRGRI